MKKGLSIALIPVICFLLGMTAISADLNKPVRHTDMTGYLFDGEGHCIEIVGRMIEQALYMSNAQFNDGVITVTYLYTIDSSAFVKTEEGSRPGSFLKLYLVNEYDQSGKLNVLTSVSGNWEVKDPDALVTGASVAYASKGARALEQYGETAVENNFEIETGFDEMLFAAAGTAGSQITLDLLVDGTKTWTFVAGNQLECHEKMGWK